MVKKSKFKIIPIIVIIIVLIIVTYTFTLEETDKKQEKLNVTTEPLLWKIQGENCSYLYGSIHIGIDEVLTLPDIVVEAIDDVDTVYTETKLDYETQTKNINVYFLPSGQSLQNLLPEDIFDRLDTYLKTKNHNAIEFNNLKIWAVGVFLTELENEEYFEKTRLDQYIWDMAVNKSKNTNGLETFEQHIGIFDNLNVEEQIQLLNDSLVMLLEEKNLAKENMDTLIDAYINGDLKTFLETEFEDYDQTDPLYIKLMDQILYNRNHNMSSTISEVISNNPDKQYFFTIGSAHFYGEDNIISLLEEKGYTITQVSFNECNCEYCDPDEIKIDDYCYYPYTPQV